MAQIQVPALQMPEQQDILGKVGQFMQLKNLMAQGQQQAAMAPGQLEQQRQTILGGQQNLDANALKIKKEQQAQQDQQTIQQAAAAHGGSLIDALPELQGKISPEVYQGIVDHIDKKKKELADLKKVELDNQEAVSNNMLGLVAEASQLPPEQYQAAWPQIAARALELNPKLAGQIDPAKPIPQQELTKLQLGIALETQLAAQSKAKREENAALAAAKTSDVKNYEAAKADGSFKGNFMQFMAQVADDKRAPVKENKPAGIEEYEFAKSQGFKGTFQEWKRDTGTRANPSEGERKAFTYYMRAKDSEDQMKGLEESISKMGLAGQTRMKVAPNWLQSDQGQLYNQLQKQFTEARLRKDSGAAIATSEYVKDRETYFAEPGDTPATIERKRKARQVILKALKQEAGRAYKETFDEEAPAAGQKKADPLGIL